MKVKFDTEATSGGCPDKGLITSDECRQCSYFVEMDGWHIICSYIEPEIEEDKNTIQEGE